MQRDPKESKEHEDLINMMAQYFTNQGFRNIKADFPGMPTPDTIIGTTRNHVPDLTVDKNGTRIVLEAETFNSIFDEHTASQWSLFSDAVQKIGGEFHIVVPKEERSAAERRAVNLGLRVDTIWTPK